MVQSQFSLTWNSYKNSICSGFTTFQQNGELVDMTLAADGHFVKVHQVLLALASPYLKELITSAPCQHPIVFLNNVSSKTMSLILEYIYTGEVLVPAEGLNAFADAAKGLHIKGLENITNSESMNYSVAMEPTSQIEEANIGHVSGVKRLGIPTSVGLGQINLPAAARNVFVKHDILPHVTKPESVSEQSMNTNQSFNTSHSYTAQTYIPPQAPQTFQPSSVSSSDYGRCNPAKMAGAKTQPTNSQDMQYSELMDDTPNNDSDDDYKIRTDVSIKPSKDPKHPSPNLQYTVSIRGSLQVILNRYIYNLQSNTHRSGMRRWRCIDYRNSKCMAFVVTKDNVVLNRANLHNHPFHDKKILAKINKKCVFSAIDDVKGYKEREELKQDSDATEQEVTIDDF